MPNESSDPVLPQELVNTIIDLLCRDRIYLHQCALVAKSWSRPCQQYLFRHIHINFHRKKTDYSQKRLDFLLQMLSRRPYLPTYIHGLTLIPFSDDAERGIPDDLVKTLAVVLDKLTSLKFLHLKIGPWHELSPSLKLVILGSVALPSLDRLTMDRTIITAEELRFILTNTVGNMSTLNLGHDVSLSSLPPSLPIGDLAPQAPSTFFATLKISSYPILHFFSEWFSDSRTSTLPLKTLDLDLSITTSGMEAEIQSLINFAAKSLIRLVISIPYSTHFFRPRKESSLILMLRHLHQIHIRQLELCPNPNGMLWMLSLFSAATMPLLKVIKLDLWYYSRSRGSHTDHANADSDGLGSDISSLNWQHWRAFDDLLSRPQYRSIEEVRILLRVNCSNATQTVEMKDILPQHLRWNMPNLRSKVIVVC